MRQDKCGGPQDSPEVVEELLLGRVVKSATARSRLAALMVARNVTFDPPVCDSERKSIPICEKELIFLVL